MCSLILRLILRSTPVANLNIIIFAAVELILVDVVTAEGIAIFVEAHRLPLEACGTVVS